MQNMKIKRSSEKCRVKRGIAETCMLGVVSRGGAHFRGPGIMYIGNCCADTMFGQDEGQFVNLVGNPVVSGFIRLRWAGRTRGVS